MKENERRRALLPRDLELIKHKNSLFFEKGYGEVLGISDSDYVKMGVKIVSREEAFHKDVVCILKTPESSEEDLFLEGQTFWGWVHAVQGRSITDFLIERKMTAIAFEDMFEDGLHSFWRNNEISGTAAVLHSIRFLGKLPMHCKAAVIGRGNVARGAFRTLSQLGVEVTVYDRKTVHRLREDIGNYDIVVNAVLWDVFRRDHLVYKEDLSKMKAGSMIVDISCDDAMGVESSHSTTIENPVYVVDGIIHYAVDHTPAIFFKSATESISSVVSRFVDDIVEEHTNPVLEQATIIKGGTIIDERIIRFQKR
jgi:N5-(carboxyethyl)ornithine synthase